MLLYDYPVESLRRETTEGQWPKKRKSSPTRRHKRNRSVKNKEVTQPDMEVSNGGCHACNIWNESHSRERDLFMYTAMY